MTNQAMAKVSTPAYELCSCCFGPWNACATTSPSVPRGLAVTLRLASRHPAGIRTNRGLRGERTCAWISSLTLDQERLVIEVARDTREARGSVRELEPEHGSVILPREEPVTPFKDGCWGIRIDAYLGTWWWDNSAGLGRLYLQLAVAAVGRVDPGRRLKVSFTYFEPEAALIPPGYPPYNEAGFRELGTQYPA
jgi:hypothetical protein